VVDEHFAKEQPLCHARRSGGSERQPAAFSMVSLSETAQRQRIELRRTDRSISRQLCDLASKNHLECLKSGVDRTLESTAQRRSGVKGDRNVWTAAAGVQRSRSGEIDHCNFVRIIQ
jgi:hypothetical protein